MKRFFLVMAGLVSLSTLGAATDHFAQSFVDTALLYKSIADELSEHSGVSARAKTHQYYTKAIELYLEACNYGHKTARASAHLLREELTESSSECEATVLKTVTVSGERTLSKRARDPHFEEGMLRYQQAFRIFAKHKPAFGEPELTGIGDDVDDAINLVKLSIDNFFTAYDDHHYPALTEARRAYKLLRDLNELRTSHDVVYPWISELRIELEKRQMTEHKRLATMKLEEYRRAETDRESVLACVDQIKKMHVEEKNQRALRRASKMIGTAVSLFADTEEDTTKAWLDEFAKALEDGK